MRCRDIVEERGELNLVDAGDDGVAETHIELHWTPCPSKKAEHLDPESAVANPLADLFDGHRVRAELDPIVASDGAHLADHRGERLRITRAVPQEVSIPRGAVG